MIAAIKIDDSGPTLSTRNIAILHVAMYDAVNCIERSSQPYQFDLTPPSGASAETAAVGAAYAVMQVLYPSVRARADDLYNNYTAQMPPTPEQTNSLAFGATIGQQALQARTADGSGTDITYIPSDAPGQWRRTPPFFRPPLTPQWRYVTPFCLRDIQPFVPPGPPLMTSDQYTADFDQVKAFGAKDSAVRTPDQTQIAIFWSDFSYTAMPPGHWQEITQVIARNQTNTLSQNARLFALVSLAQADAAIVCWEAKYRYNFWRPITAIQRADQDGNPATIADTNWTSLLVAPSFPEYTSGHSTFSRASAQTITHFYRTDSLSFSIGSDSLPGVYRSFTSLSTCADEVGMSRIYGGIHFMTANRDGQACGAKIADYVFANYLLPNDQLPRLLVGLGTQGRPEVRLHGHVGRSCVVESSADLRSWQTISTNTAVVGGLTVVDPQASPGGTRFYRAREF